MTMPRSDVIVGIDPGLKGGVAAVIGDRVLFARPMPLAELDERRSRVDGTILAEWYEEACDLANSARLAVYIENAWGRKGDGSGAAFTFGFAWGVPVDRAHDYADGDIHLINPKKWQVEMLTPFYPPDAEEGEKRLNGRERSKAGSVARVRKIHPSINLRPGRCRVDQDGIADAVNIADYGWLDNVGRLGIERTPQRRRSRQTKPNTARA